MEQFLESGPHPRTARISHNHFTILLTASLLLHLCISVIMVMPGRSRIAAPVTHFFDLTMTAPATAEPAMPAVQEPAMTEEKEIPVPEQQPVPPAAAEFDKLQQSAREAVDGATDKPEALSQSSLALGITSGYFSSFAEGETLHASIRDYYFRILREINEKWWVTTGGKNGARSKAVVNVFIARDGKVLKAQMSQGPGSVSYDRSLLKAVEVASPLPPLPKEYPFTVFEAPLLFNPPLFLLTR